MNTGTAILIVGLIVVVGGGAFILSQRSAAPEGPRTSPSEDNSARERTAVLELIGAGVRGFTTVYSDLRRSSGTGSQPTNQSARGPAYGT